MNSQDFIEKCKRLVADYTNAHMDRTDAAAPIIPEGVFVVWSCKTLQNNKALLSTNVTDGMYYEVTYNGNRDEIYFDIYKKFENQCIKL